METEQEEKYLQALREIDIHILMDAKPIPFIVDILIDALPEYQEKRNRISRKKKTKKKKIEFKKLFNVIS